MKRILVAALVLVAACKNESSTAYKGAPAETFPASRSAVDATLRQASVGLAAPAAQTQAATSPTVILPSELRMMIRNANLSMIVRDAADVLHRATAIVEARGGYVADQRQWQDRNQARAMATLRVPSAQLTNALGAIRGLAVRVDSETISGQDVSQEFTDLGAQLKNLQATEAELRELLTVVRQRTQKASQILEIFGELTRVRGEIERIQGRMQYLAQMSAFSTITLDLIPDALAAPVVEPGWQPQATAKAAVRALLNAMKAAADVAIWVALYLLPIALMFVLLALGLRAVWVWRRRALIVTGDDAA